MDWIKKHYDRVALLIFAVVLIASAAFLYQQTQALPGAFTDAQKPYERKEKIDAIDLTPIENGIKAISAPGTWATHPGSLFVSRKYLPRDGELVDPLEGNSIEIHPGVPNEWLIKNGFDLLDPNVLNLDPDGDGFTVLDEYLGKTDPNDKNSHPPYYTKLRLKKYIKRPFRMKFSAYDEDSFQINALDIKIPSQFLKIGEKIDRTKFKIIKFEKKVEHNASTGQESDVSELTVVNEETNEEVRLILDRVVDSPDSFASFVFLIDRSEFHVKKDHTFHLAIDPKVEFKLVDINDKEAVITNVATGEKITIPKAD